MENITVRVNKNDVAIELVNMGYKIVKLEKNLKQPQKTCFFFLEEGDIRTVIGKLKEKYWN